LVPGMAWEAVGGWLLARHLRTSLSMGGATLSVAAGQPA
jgi:hypothetical protein